MPVVIHTSIRKTSVTGRLKVTARWARPRCKNTVDTSKARHETPNPTNKLKAMTRNIGTVYRAYLLVGRGT